MGDLDLGYQIGIKNCKSLMRVIIDAIVSANTEPKYSIIPWGSVDTAPNRKSFPIK